MDIASFVTTNDANLSAAFKAIYVCNASTNNYQSLTTGHLHPGQAFFINSDVASGNASITTAMQSHQTGITFYKNGESKVTLSIAQGKETRETQISYLTDATKSLDPGFDIGLFDGVATNLSLYTHLVENGNNIKFDKQALPLSEIVNVIIPIGVKALANKELIFSIAFRKSTKRNKFIFRR